MSELYVLDTDAVIDVLHGMHGVRERLDRIPPDDVALSAMTLAELLYGADMSSDAQQSRTEIFRLLRRVRILAFGLRAAQHHAGLRKHLRPSPIGPSDLVIAATVLGHQGILVTANIREFGRVPGLVVENWRV